MSDERPEDDVEMSLLGHLEELRKRLFYAAVGVVPTVTAAWIFKERLLDLLVAPLLTAWTRLKLGPTPSLHFANPVDPFVAYLQIALVVGLIGAAPWLFWQVWAFISPGLYRKERRLAIPFVVASTLFFVGGTVFGYIVVFPLAFETFLSFAGKLPSGSVTIQPTIMLGEYLAFAARMLLAFGAVFEVPVVVFFLAMAGIVSPGTLLRFGRWWVVIASIIAALLTPPDVGSQMIMLIPLIVLYYASVGLAYLFVRK